MSATTEQAVYAVRDLSVAYPGRDRPVEAVRDVSLELRRGEILAVVGESGSGKSTLGRALSGLLPAGSTATASAWDFDGTSLVGAHEAAWRTLRGRRIGVVFQDPATCLNPVWRVRDHLVEALRLHAPQLDKAARLRRCAELLERLGIPAERLDAFPHQLSGGMRQRVMIALANACGADVLIADEPTTALDVLVQPQFLDLIRELVRDEGLGVLLITHDFGIVEDVADRVAVMYAGEVVELGARDEVIDAPRHPYTRALVGSIPRIDEDVTGAERLTGLPPALTSPPPGCRFHPRCPVAGPECERDRIATVSLPGGHLAKCLRVTADDEGRTP